MNAYARIVPISVVLALSAAAAPAAASNGAQSYCFAKQVIGSGSWAGTYAAATPGEDCDPSGGLPMTSTLTSFTASGQAAHITITWRFMDAQGGLAFETQQRGILHLRSGAVVLNGYVTAGDALGARTHDQGWPTDAVGSYAGTMRVMP